MNIEETINEAASRFGVTVTEILSGRHRRAHVICAREWIIEQHPNVSDNALSKALHLKTHSTVTYARQRIRARINTIHN